MPTETPTIETQTIQGPDQKWYKVKVSDMDKFDKKFTKQGWVKSKEGKWLTATGEDASKQKGVPSQQPHTELGGVATGRRSKTTLEDPSRITKEGLLTAYMGQSLPSIGGMIGGTIAKTPGAAAGGAIGEGLKQLYRRQMLNEQMSNTETVKRMLIEGMKQGALQKAGDKIGDLFFGALKKIAFAKVKDGIPFLPSEYKPGGKLYKMVEDLLSNLAPSAKTMEEFKSKQTAAINDKLSTFVDGMSKFKGTSEDMGNLLKGALKSGEESFQKQKEVLMKGYAKKGFSNTQAQRYLEQTTLYKNYMKEFNNTLAKKIGATNKPELIAGLLRVQGKESLEETRILKATVEELKPGLWGKVQNRVMRDAIQKLYTGVTDPVAQGVTKYSGDKFKQILNESGEERLKIIYGETGYKNIQEFIKLTEHIGNGGTGMGRMMNIFLLVSPIRSGLTTKTITHTGLFALAINRVAKAMTSTEGIEITNKYVRATIQHSPQLANLALKELEKFNQRTDAEYKADEEQGEREYEQEKGKQ